MSAPAVRSSRGFSLVELMIAMLVSMIVAIAIFQSLYVSESEARANAGTTTAQNRASLALLMLQRDTRQAGYGLNANTMIGCRAIAAPPALPDDVPVVAPVRIEPATPAARLVKLSVMSGSSGMTGPAYHIDPNIASTQTEVVVKSSRFGVAVDDIVLLSEPGKDCALAKVVALPAEVHPNPGARMLNVQSSSGISYQGTSARVSNLGASPTYNVYEVNAKHQLVVRNGLSSTPGESTALVDGVVGFLAWYGRDTLNNGVLEFSNVQPTTPDEWSKVVAVKVAIVMRNEHRERKDASSSDCNATITPPVVDGVSVDLADIPDWKCHQYRMVQTIVPLRNNLWRPE